MNKDNLRRYCFVESKEYVLDNYRWIPEKLMLDGNIVTKKERVFSFNLTGFLVHENDIYIIFPKNHKIPDNYGMLLNHIQTLAGVLLRYQNEGSLQEKENDLHGDVDGMVPEGIASSLWIIRDYVEYGFIQRQVQRKVYSGSNIDWSRTIKTTHPIITSSGTAYFDPVYRKTSVDYNNMIYFLHRYVVQKSFQKFGWILGYNSFEMESFNNELPCDVELAVYLLNKELDSTFNDREIILIKSLIDFIQGSDRVDQKTTLDTLSTNYFHNVWEAMCGFVFQNHYHSLKKYIPKPIWHLHDGSTDSTHQRPDILFVENSMLYILDAKYYNIPKSLPGWYDLVKQFFYGYSLKHKFPKMHNVLIFPDTVLEQIKFFGYVEMHNRAELGKVYSVTVDTYTLMKDYCNYRYGSWKELLVNQLTKAKDL